MRYIGCTTKENESFRKRIHQRYRTGSETHSRYFSKIYNCGRMYRNRLTQQSEHDAKIAKDLRSAFIAEYCRAVYVPLEAREAEILALETAIAVAPPECILWNRATTMVYPEPEDLVDALIARLDFSVREIEAVERQRAFFEHTVSRATLLACQIIPRVGSGNHFRFQPCWLPRSMRSDAILRTGSGPRYTWSKTS